MKPEIEMSFDWKSVSVTASELLALLRKYRMKKLDVLFHYGQQLYHVGVNPENRGEPFYMEEETYPSMLAFCSTACVADGFLLPDLQDKLDVLAVNGEAPEQYF